MAQLVQCPTLDFHSGHDLTVHEIEPTSASVLTAWSLVGILSPALSLPHLHTLSQNKQTLKNNNCYALDLLNAIKSH